jgi:hypothetical protein
MRLSSDPEIVVNEDGLGKWYYPVTNDFREWTTALNRENRVSEPDKDRLQILP